MFIKIKYLRCLKTIRIYINRNILSLLEDLKKKINFVFLSSACSLRAIEGNSVIIKKKEILLNI